MHTHRTDCQVTTHYPKFQSHNHKAHTIIMNLYLDQQGHQHRKSNNNTTKNYIAKINKNNHQIYQQLNTTIHLTYVQRDWSLDSRPEVQIPDEAASHSHVVNHKGMHVSLHLQ